MSEVCKTGYCCTRIENLCVQKGTQTILHDVGFHIHCGQLTSIIGRNGAGKTTLIKALLGEVKHTGTIHFHNHQGKHKKLRIGYVPQKLNLDENAPSTVYDFCATFLSKQPVFLCPPSLRPRDCGDLGAGPLETQVTLRPPPSPPPPASDPRDLTCSCSLTLLTDHPR